MTRGETLQGKGIKKVRAWDRKATPLEPCVPADQSYSQANLTTMNKSIILRIDIAKSTEGEDRTCVSCAFSCGSWPGPPWDLGCPEALIEWPCCVSSTFPYVLLQTEEPPRWPSTCAPSADVAMQDVLNAGIASTSVAYQLKLSLIFKSDTVLLSQISAPG